MHVNTYSAPSPPPLPKAMAGSVFENGEDSKKWNWPDDDADKDDQQQQNEGKDADDHGHNHFGVADRLGRICRNTRNKIDPHQQKTKQQWHHARTMVIITLEPPAGIIHR